MSSSKYVRDFYKRSYFWCCENVRMVGKKLQRNYECGKPALVNDVPLTWFVYIVSSFQWTKLWGYFKRSWKASSDSTRPKSSSIICFEFPYGSRSGSFLFYSLSINHKSRCVLFCQIFVFVWWRQLWRFSNIPCRHLQRELKCRTMLERLFSTRLWFHIVFQPTSTLSYCNYKLNFIDLCSLLTILLRGLSYFIIIVLLFVSCYSKGINRIQKKFGQKKIKFWQENWIVVKKSNFVKQ